MLQPLETSVNEGKALRAGLIALRNFSGDELLNTLHELVQVKVGWPNTILTIFVILIVDTLLL
jgi:hypothetical protein